MAQGEFTKEEAQVAREAVTEICRRLTMADSALLNQRIHGVFAFLNAAQAVAPHEREIKAMDKESQPGLPVGDSDG